MNEANPEIEEKVQGMIAQAKSLRKSHQYNEAIDLLLDALEYNVLRAELYYHIGNVHYDANNLKKAEYAYQRALEIDPSHANATNNLAVVYKRQGKVYQSWKMQKQVLRLELHQPRRRKRLAMSTEQSQRVKKFARQGLLFVFGLLGLFLFIIYLLGYFLSG